MQYASSSGYRRRKRSRVRYDGRSWGSSTTPREPKPSVRKEAAEQALADVLELFANPERLPAAIARTVIARAEGTGPMEYWSLPNQLLCILAGSTDCRGIRQWNQAGRRVKKGAKAVRILAPRTRKIREADPETGEESERVLTVGFVGVPVFRYQDTEGAPLELPDYQPASFPPLYGVALRLGVDVSYAPFVERFRGYYSHDRAEIILCSHDVEVFFHELAHAAHDDVLSREGKKLEGGQVPRQEIVAEVVAAVLCELYGFEGYLPHCRQYVASYSGKEGPARGALKVLGDVQAVLLAILEPVPDWALATRAEREREAVAA